MPLVRPLDRYVFGEFARIFAATALGLPLLLMLIDLTDNLEKYLQRALPKADIALSYLYFIPDTMFMALPAAVLFATVFAVGGFTRHSEITAAKASGISFYRMAVPIFVGAMIAGGLNLMLGELVPLTNARRADLLAESRFRSDMERMNFAHAGDEGRVYKASRISRADGVIDFLQIEREGSGADFPTVIVSAKAAKWEPAPATPRTGWVISDGTMHVMPDSSRSFAVSFARMHDNLMVERPIDLLARQRGSNEMRYAELGRFISSLERSGGDANVLRVERALKLAIPVTCLVIAFFAAPLATSTQRGGTAYGVGISLGVTVVFLLLVQLTKAIGGKALIPPDLAAWIPNVLFAVIGVVLLSRVRT